MVLVFGLGGLLVGCALEQVFLYFRESRNIDSQLAELRDSYEPCRPTISRGTPNKGTLRCGVILSPHPRIKQLTLAQFGTRETVMALHRAADRLEQLDPGGPPMRVMDLSHEGGGRFRGHASHQSGRDVDLRFIYQGEEQPRRGFRNLPLDRLDGYRSWLLVDSLIKTGRVKVIFIDHEVQEVLYNAAKEAKARNLKRIFQYPRGEKVRAGIIRHWPNHRSHLHIRYRCPRGSKGCRG